MPQNRFVFLDGLRGIAALAVVLLHLTSNNGAIDNVVTHASLAVDFFFILSGFVIAFAYDERLRTGRLGFWPFATARMIRLYPMLLIGLAFGAMVFLVRIATRAEWNMIFPFIEALFLSLLMLPSHLISGQGYSTAYPFNVPSWSLFFELVANAVYAALARRMTNTVVALATGVGALGLFAVILSRGHVTGGQDWATFLLGFWRVLFAFSAGVLIFRFDNLAPKLPPLAGWLLALGLVALFTAPTAPSWVYDGVCVFVAFPVIIVLGAGVRITGTVAKICLFAGRLSYPLYLIHYPAVRIGGLFLRTHPLQGFDLTLFFGAMLIIIIALSVLCLVFIDEPIRRALGRRVRRTNPPILAIDGVGRT